MTDEKNNLNPHDDEVQEIDLMDLAKKLWSARRFILKAAAYGIVVGLVVAFSIPREYTTTIKLAPELGDNKQAAGGLGALASMAGLNAGGASKEAVTPQLYPDIVSSIPFAVGLFDVPVTDISGKNHTTIRRFIEEDTSEPWWSTLKALPGMAIGGVKSLFTDEDDEAASDTINAFRLSRREAAVAEAIIERIGIDVDNKTFVVTLSTTMQDPMVSALLADTVVERLKTYVTEYRTSKAKEDLKYAEKLNEEAKADYHKAQQTYADYMDKNQGIVLRSARTEQERLQNEAALAFNLYNATAQRLQSAKAKVQEITPVYAVVQPASVPLTPSKPSKPMIIVIFVFLAAAGASAWVLFGKNIVADLKKQKN